MTATPQPPQGGAGLTPADFQRAEEIAAISFEFSARVQGELKRLREQVEGKQRVIDSKTEANRFEVEQNNLLRNENAKHKRDNQVILGVTIERDNLRASLATVTAERDGLRADNLRLVNDLEAEGARLEQVQRERDEAQNNYVELEAASLGHEYALSAIHDTRKALEKERDNAVDAANKWKETSTTMREALIESDSVLKMVAYNSKIDSDLMKSVKWAEENTHNALESSQEAHHG